MHLKPGVSSSLVRPMLLMWLLLWNHSLPAADDAFAHDHQTIEHQGIQLIGTTRFTGQVQSCLDLLAEKTPEDLAFIQQYIGVIKQHKKSGMVAWANPPRYEMSAKTAFYSITWCASTIAHDAMHSRLYQKYRHVQKGQLLHKLWAGFKAESRAIHFQTQVAKRLSAPEEELHYLRNLKGTHSDLDGDRKLTNKDYQKRDW